MEEEIDFMELIKYFWRKKIWIILIAIVSVILSMIYTTRFVKPEYTATAAFILTNDELKTEAEVYSYAKLPDRYFAIANSRNVLEKVINNLKLTNIEDIMKFKENNIEITHSPANFLITIEVTTNNAKEAADIANEIVKVTLEEIKNIYNDEKIQILDTAVEDWKPINIKLITNIITFVFFGEVIVCGYMVIIYIFVEMKKNDKIKLYDEKEKIGQEYKIKVEKILKSINKIEKYKELIKERNVLEKRLKNEEYKKILKINDEILKCCVEEAYIEGYMEAIKSKDKLVE